jgi:hypothetical protein
VNVEQRHVPECLAQASALIDSHVNRLAAGSDRPLDALDRCVVLRTPTMLASKG